MKEDRDVIAEDCFELANKLTEVLGGKVAVLPDTCDQAPFRQRIFKQVCIDSKNNIGEHLDKPAIGIPSEPRILGLPN